MAREMQEVEMDERHPIRFLVKFALFFGLLYAAGRFLVKTKSEFADLTESQARDRLVEKMGPKVGDDTANEIADQVIPKLKDRGLIKQDPGESATDGVEVDGGEVADVVEEKVEQTADKVTEAVDSVVKD